ncbi:hypothetical protein GWI33_012043, partial [Rhynchophorus ferrugineus]
VLFGPNIIPGINRDFIRSSRNLGHILLFGRIPSGPGDGQGPRGHRPKFSIRKSFPITKSAYQMTKFYGRASGPRKSDGEGKKAAYQRAERVRDVESEVLRRHSRWSKLSREKDFSRFSVLPGPPRNTVGGQLMEAKSK